MLVFLLGRSTQPVVPPSRPTLTELDLLDAFPFKDRLALVEMSGQRLLSVLEQGLSLERGMLQISGIADFEELVTKAKRGIPVLDVMVDKKTLFRGTKPKKAGTLKVLKSRILHIPSMLQYLSGGCELDLMVAIDCTLNNGNPFPNNIDITHNLTLGATYSWKQFEFSLGSYFRTGIPNTTVGVPNLNNGNINFNAPNADNLEAYFRTDFSSTYRLTLSKKKKIYSKIGLS